MDEKLSFQQTFTLACEGAEGIAKSNDAFLASLLLQPIIDLLTHNSYCLLLDRLTLVLLLDLF